MSSQAFYDLLRRYVDGKCTEEEKKVVEQWYSMLDDEDLPDIQEAELSVLAEKTWNTINAKTRLYESIPEQKPQNGLRYWLPRLSVAASVTGLIAAMSYLLPVRQDVPGFLKTDGKSLIQKINDTSQPDTVLLADGSTVVLQPQSELTYSKRFTQNHREVFVRGEALFQVQEDKEHPFYVYSHDLITQVVGTTFIVRSNEKNDQSEVVVLTGKVIVTKNESDNRFYQKILPVRSTAVTLTPNQKVVYHRKEELTVTLIEDPAPVAMENEDKPNFLFNESPLSEVISGIEKTFGIGILLTDKKIYQCTFTGDLTDQSMHDMLEFVVQSVGATYKIDGTKILIEGGNCN